MSAFTPLDGFAALNSPYPTGLTREVNNMHISDGHQWAYDGAPSQASSSSTSPVDPHFPQLPPSSWGPSVQASYVSASYQSASVVAPLALPQHLPRATPAGLPSLPPHYPHPPNAHRYGGWDLPTPPSEAASPRTSEPESHAYTTYSLPQQAQPQRPPPPISARRPRLQHSLSLPMPPTDMQVTYSNLIGGQEAAYHPPPKYDSPSYPRSAHSTSVVLERQANVDAYFQSQPVHHHNTFVMPHNGQPHHQHHQQQQYQEQSYRPTFTTEPTYTRPQDPMFTPLVDQPLSPNTPSGVSGGGSRRSSAGGMGGQYSSAPMETTAEQFTFQYGPGW